MTDKDIAELITDTKRTGIKITIPNSDFSQEVQGVKDIIKNHGNLESYISKIAESKKVLDLIIGVYGDDGYYNSGKRRYDLKKEYDVSLPKNNQGDLYPLTPSPLGDINPLTVSPSGDKVINAIETPQKQAITPEKHTTMQDKDYIDYKVLEVKHDTLKHQHEESKSKIVKLEKKVEDLHEENKTLLRENLTKEDKHTLALERQKFDADKSANENKESLSGLAGDFFKDPDNIKMLVGFINPKHPMFDKEPQSQLTGADDAVREIKYTTDATANQVLNDIPRILSQKDGDAIAKVYLLFQKMMSSPEIFGEIIKKYVPELPH